MCSALYASGAGFRRGSFLVIVRHRRAFEFAMADSAH